jgi:hypothetical protein
MTAKKPNSSVKSYFKRSPKSKNRNLKFNSHEFFSFKKIKNLPKEFLKWPKTLKI